MKNLNFKTILFIIFFSLFVLASQAKAEGTTTVQLKVVALGQVLFDNNFIVNPCPSQASSTEYTLNAWCAVDQLVSSQGWAATSTWYPYGIMLNAINQYEGTDSNYWLWFSNFEPGETALNQHILSNGEKLLLSFSTSPLKITASSTSPYINTTTTLNALYFDTSSWQWQLATSSIFSINGQEISSASGTYELRTSTTTAYRVFAKGAGFIDSEPITINPQLPSININLRIETASSTMFNNNFIVNPCSDQASSTSYTLNAWCAVDQLISSQGWAATSTWYPYGIMLNAINQYEGTDSSYWLWFSNSEIGATALNQHLLTDGENLLLTYGISPLKITASSTSPFINSTTTLNAFYFDASFWQWQPAASSTFIINEEQFFSADGNYELFVATSIPYSVFGCKLGSLDSPILTLTGIFQDNTSSEPALPNNPGGGGSGGGAQTHYTVDVNKAINFLVLNQNSDGSIGSSVIYSDWAGIALSAFGNGDANNKLKNYLSGAKYNTNGSVTDLERRAMALMALSINPYSGTATDYISKILSAFDGTQIGDPNLFNDDIFALFPLLKAGYSGSDPIIKATVKFIISKQGANGSWGNIDLTAGAIQALSLAKKTGNLDADITNLINQSLQFAKSSLKNSQDANGGFGNNTISTAWAVQAIVALDEQVLAWENNGNNPFDFLASRQNSDGGLEDASVAVDTRIWTTAYVIPAALGKTWGEILGSFQKEVQNNKTGGANNLSATSTFTSATTSTSTPFSTSTLELASSTTSLAFATTSIDEIITKVIPATSTATSSGTVLLQTEKGQNLSLIEPANSIQQNEPAEENYPNNLTAQISDSVGSGHSNNAKTMNTIFYLSLGVASLLGLYLTIKFLIFKP